MKKVIVFLGSALLMGLLMLNLNLGRGKSAFSFTLLGIEQLIANASEGGNYTCSGSSCSSGYSAGYQNGVYLCCICSSSCTGKKGVKN